MTIEGLKDRVTLLRLLISDKGSGITHHTQLHKTHTHKKGKKLVEKERQQEKAKYTSIFSGYQY